MQLPLTQSQIFVPKYTTDDDWDSLSVQLVLEKRMWQAAAMGVQVYLYGKSHSCDP